MPRILACCDPSGAGAGAVREAAAALRRGGLVVLPTDTVYGVAADPGVPGAEARLFRCKDRPDDKPVALLAADTDQIAEWGVRWGSAARALARRFWPGALTLVLEARGRMEGFRIPDHAVTRAVLRVCGAPLRVSSANLSGEPPTLTAAGAGVALGDRVDLVLDAGPAPGGVPSTVIRFEGDHPVVLREGAIAVKDIVATCADANGVGIFAS